MSEPIRELAKKDPRTEKESSSSAAALTLALSSGRSDSFSSKANVVPEVMLFPSRLGGLVPRSELESALCELSSEGVWLFAVLLDPTAEVPLTMTFGGLFSSFKSFESALPLYWGFCCLVDLGVIELLSADTSAANDVISGTMAMRTPETP